MTQATGSQYECYGKTAYQSYYGANRQSNKLNRQRDGARVNIYRCSTCHDWHVGNSLGTIKRKRVSRNNEYEEQDDIGI